MKTRKKRRGLLAVVLAISLCVAVPSSYYYASARATAVSGGGCTGPAQEMNGGVHCTSSNDRPCSDEFACGGQNEDGDFWRDVVALLSLLVSILK